MLSGSFTVTRLILDIAVSQQTHRPRIVFEENSGLAEVIPIDRVNETIETFRASRP